MAVMKCDTMIDLMPDMWLSSQPQEDLDDDVDEYDRLVIDTSDPPQKSNAVMENETCDSKMKMIMHKRSSEVIQQHRTQSHKYQLL